MNNLIPDSGVGSVTETSWQPAAALTFDEWMQVGRTLQTIGGAINWWVGDWLNYGEGRYGEMYTQAIEATGWGLEHLKQCKWVAGRVEKCTRVHDLSYTHHRHVAHLSTEEQSFWLTFAQAEGWRSGELKTAIQLAARGKAWIEDDDVPYSGSGPSNIDEDAPEAVREYEGQDCALPVLSWMAMEQVRGLVRSVRAGQWSDATVLARALAWMLEDADDS